MTEMLIRWHNVIKVLPKMSQYELMHISDVTIVTGIVQKQKLNVENLNSTSYLKWAKINIE